MKDAKGHGSNAHSAGVDALPATWTGVGYHGTAATFEKFRPNEPTTFAGTKDLKGVYFSGDQRAASGYASQAQRRAGGPASGARQQVIGAKLTMTNPLDITNAIKNGQRRGLSFGDAKRAAMKGLTPHHDGVIFKGNSMNPPEYIVFHDAQIKRLPK